MRCLPLSLLPILVGGKTLPDMKAAVNMADRLKADLNHMLLEHKETVGALKVLTYAARNEGKDEFVHFSEKLTLRAQNEDEVPHPASILVGEYLKLRLTL